MSLPVFLAAPAELAAATHTICLTGAEAKHAATVRRVRVGERIDVADGQGNRVRGEVTSVDKQTVCVRVTARGTDRRHGPCLALVQALAKGGRDEQAVETATELGVEQIVPWQALRSVSVWADGADFAGPKARKGVARWQAIAQSAAKQARRALVPQVAQARGHRTLVDWIRDVVAVGGAVILLHEEATVPLADIELPSWDGDGPRPTLAVVVGPEGGIGAAETADLVAAGAQLARLGPHVLRTSSAGPAALAVLGQKLGLWAGGADTIDLQPADMKE